MEGLSRTSHCICRNIEDLARVILRVYPDHKWDITKLLRQAGPIKSAQRMLAVAVQQLFPGTGNNKNCVTHHLSDVREDYLHPALFFKSGKPMELDVFVFQLNLAFEYQVP